MRLWHFITNATARKMKCEVLVRDLFRMNSRIIAGIPENLLSMLNSCSRNK